MQSVQDVGIVGLFVIFLLREIFNFIKNKKEDRKESRTDKMIKDLWEWHSKEDSDGVKVWYIRQSLEGSVNRLETSLVKLSDNIAAQTEVLRSLVRDIEETRIDVKETRKEIDYLEKKIERTVHVSA